jgi:hypothetical protein
VAKWGESLPFGKNESLSLHELNFAYGVVVSKALVLSFHPVFGQTLLN